MTEREWDRRLHIRTIGREDESRANCSPYEPTPYAVLERLAASGRVRRKSHLVDYGCGKGRVACFLAATVGCRVTGVDYSERLIGLAAQNRRDSRTGDRVALVCCRAERYPVDEQDAFYFFNPFSEKLFAAVLRRIEQSWRARPRRMTLICYYPSEAYIRCLEDMPQIAFVDEIDCGDLFSGDNPRERIVVYALPKGEGTDDFS